MMRRNPKADRNLGDSDRETVEAAALAVADGFGVPIEALPQELIARTREQLRELGEVIGSDLSGVADDLVRVFHLRMAALLLDHLDWSDVDAAIATIERGDDQRWNNLCEQAALEIATLHDGRRAATTSVIH